MYDSFNLPLQVVQLKCADSHTTSIEQQLKMLDNPMTIETEWPNHDSVYSYPSFETFQMCWMYFSKRYSAWLSQYK